MSTLRQGTITSCQVIHQGRTRNSRNSETTETPETPRWSSTASDNKNKTPKMIKLFPAITINDPSLDHPAAPAACCAEAVVSILPVSPKGPASCCCDSGALRTFVRLVREMPLETQRQSRLRLFAGLLAKRLQTILDPQRSSYGGASLQNPATGLTATVTAPTSPSDGREGKADGVRPLTRSTFLKIELCRALRPRGYASPMENAGGERHVFPSATSDPRSSPLAVNPGTSR